MRNYTVNVIGPAGLAVLSLGRLGVRMLRWRLPSLGYALAVRRPRAEKWVRGPSKVYVWRE